MRSLRVPSGRWPLVSRPASTVAMMVHRPQGISVDSATDVAKDAADVILLKKDLSVLADGVAEGRRTFANTIKYVLMGTSSNFGNMFSAAGSSLFLKFLPMLPSQILLNNLLYDTSQLAIPTDNVDEEQLRRPSHWDIGFIRRFMIFFGPLSSVFDFITFGVTLWVFHSGPAQFRSGWFVESLATQTLVIFAIRTRRVPFFRSHPTAADRRRPRRRHNRHRAPGHAAGPDPRLPATARSVLRRAGRHGRRLPGPHRGRQADLLPRRRHRACRAAALRPAPPPAPPRRPFQHRRQLICDIRLRPAPGRASLTGQSCAAGPGKRQVPGKGGSCRAVSRRRGRRTAMPQGVPAPHSGARP
jgi:hypothetical protein